MQRISQNAPDQPYIHKIDLDLSYIQAWIVDGGYIRDNVSIEFVFGGHDLVYGFIPSNEIWIDNDVAPDEQRFTLLHELYERGLMISGEFAESAHESANEIEWTCRIHPAKYKENFTKALELNKI